MLTYSYTARNPQTGKQVKATVQADSESAAAKLISAEGLVATSVVLAGEKGGFGFKSKVRAKDRVLFSRQLSTLINAGLPLLQALRSVSSQTTSKPLKVVLSQVIGDVEGGSTLASAMGKHPRVFNQVYLSLIAAGESSGTLDQALDRLAIQQEKEADLNSKIRGAMIYPVVVLVIMVLVVGFMVVKVLPQVKNIYEGMQGQELPLLTRMMLAVSDFVIGFWWVILLILAFGIFFTTRWARTGPGKQVIDKLKMKAWPIGKLFMKVYMARFARTGATLVASGVPLLQMLNITSEAVNNVHISGAITRAADKVKGGKSLADSIENDPNFLPLVPNMVRIGEQSGAIEQMMAKVADYYEKEVDTEVENISSIIEPVMMVALGIVAFMIVAAVLLPIYGLAGNDNLAG
ncbi:pilus assembly protein PilC [Candidatus Saccharibacteria bacterium]|nr:MAG: pilus assembly protein PilC [Candidatus Saccharibacteria bacterium]PID98892.1 MAG: pilus assembly protein PilC [Candidatus Saccharibacteria bacterium]